jgi:hypothetical protein
MSSQQAARHFAADIASDSSNCKHVFSPPRIFDDFTACEMRTNWTWRERSLWSVRTIQHARESGHSAND